MKSFIKRPFNFINTSYLSILWLLLSPLLTLACPIPPRVASASFLSSPSILSTPEKLQYVEIQKRREDANASGTNAFLNLDIEVESSQSVPPFGNFEYVFKLQNPRKTSTNEKPIYKKSPVFYDSAYNNVSGDSKTKWKRANSTLAETSFILNFDCDTTAFTASLCQAAKKSMASAMNRISKVIYIAKAIVVNVVVECYCCSPSMANYCSARTLGYTYPASFYTWVPSKATMLGADFNYRYPSALAKQFVPNDPTFSDPSAVDIYVSMNGQSNWWFPSPSDLDGSPYSSGFQYKGNSTLTDMYDFEQVAMHELHHGLGFISSWSSYDWQGVSFMLPSDQGTLPNIFNKFLADNKNGIWMRDYENTISSYLVQTANKNAIVGGESVPLFTTTPGYEIAQYVYTNLMTSPQSILFWFPKSFTGPKIIPSYMRRVPNMAVFNASFVKYQLNFLPDYAIMYTPKKYSDGSTLSHVDAQTYRGTSSYLMRPFGTPGAGLDSISPASRVYGPEGKITLGIMAAMGYTTALSFSLSSTDT